MERGDLLLMREEEKVAHDVYQRLYERWGLRPFGNIVASEQMHMDAMRMLLDRYGLPDPVEGFPIGRFASPAIQSLHAELLQQGLQSEAEAVRVGLRIEELDIADLRNAAGRPDRRDILAVYADLERGSRNHLRAFYRWMPRLGTHYVPAHMSPADFESVARSEHERCHRCSAERASPPCSRQRSTIDACQRRPERRE